MTIRPDIALAVIFLLTKSYIVVGNPQEKRLNAPLAELTTHEIILKYNYPAETHNVVTADGYILTIHRIANPGRPSVFIQHGLLGSSADWILLGPNKALGFFLYNAGYDVWIGNTRGNRYSKKHQWLSTKDSAFWNFSFHESGIYDLPAMLDYVLGVTGEKSLYYVGHSMGSTIVFVMASMMPEYNSKIKVMFALAPGAFYSERTNMYFRLAVNSKVGREAEKLYSIELFPYVKSQRRLFQKICRDGIPLQPMCKAVISTLGGNLFSTQIDKSLMPTIFSHFPAGSSVKCWVHYGQLIRSDKFRQYDHGKALNLKYYNSPEPPEYNLSAVTLPISVHAGITDSITTYQGIEKLYRSLPNTIGLFPVPIPLFNHFDFMYGKDARKAIYEFILNIMRHPVQSSHPTFHNNF